MDSKSIQQQLLAIETEHRVQVLYACESGSRAWGFPSADSDYDVRFIYVHPTEWYLSIEELADTIDPRIEGALDLGGWDIRKALRLLRKGNCPIIEWLSSPIVYHEDAAAIAPLKRLALPSFLPESACHHYLAMAIRHTDALRAAEAPSLKQLDLQQRLFKYRCSYLIESSTFDGLQRTLRRRVLRRLWRVLTDAAAEPRYDYLETAEREGIREILTQTLHDVPATWHARN